jgi:O-antigen/teichoic acid export membrane protein
MSVVYLFALLLAYFLPAYSSNQFLIWGLPIGMIFSAGFMTAGIIQIPLQLFRKMEKLSIALILARVSQLLILVASVFFLFKRAEICPAEEFCLQSPEYSIPAFLVILLSVFASIFTQGIYVRIKSNKYLKLKIKFDFKFIKNMIFQNFQY